MLGVRRPRLLRNTVATGLLALLAAGAAPAQEAEEGNPLARRARAEKPAPTGMPAWVGAYGDLDEGLILGLLPAEDGVPGGVEGVLGLLPPREPSDCAVWGKVEADGTVRGNFAADGRTYALVVRSGADGGVVLESGGQTYRLMRLRATDAAFVDEMRRNVRQAHGRATDDGSKPRAGATPAQGEGKGADLAHVKVGQRWVYSLQGGQMEMVWQVKAIDAKAGRVQYTTQVHMDMGQGKQPIGDPQDQEWVFSPMAQGPGPAVPGVEVEQKRRRMKVGALELDCMVVHSEVSGTTAETWIPMAGDHPTFPGLARSASNGAVVMELVRVE